MASFATQFPVKVTITNGDFTDLAIEWLQGIAKSAVLEKAVDRQMYDDDARIEGEDRELFNLKSVTENSTSVIGLRHDLPDNFGRLWRTECVLTRTNKQAWVRVRCQCLKTDPDAHIIMPKKPYIIKMMLKNGWAERDGSQFVFDSAHHLKDEDLDLAANIVLGKENAVLPFVYVTERLPADAGRFPFGM